jgi:hypothetical protein
VGAFWERSALLAVLFALVAAPAQAGPWRDHARQVARDTFGLPTCGEPRIIRRDPLTYAGGAQADWLRDATAWADPERCAVVLSSRVKIHTRWRWCHVVAHEWGHLAGYEHSIEPFDLMYEGETGHTDWNRSSSLRSSRSRL